MKFLMKSPESSGSCRGSEKSFAGASFRGIARKSSGRFSFLRDEKAVSPVVAVLLLLAVTVLMAGYVAVSVLSYDIEEPAPSVALRAETMTVDGISCIRLSHRGGDTLLMNETVILFNGEKADASGLSDASFSIGESILVCRSKGKVCLTDQQKLPASPSDLFTSSGSSRSGGTGGLYGSGRSELIIIDSRTDKIIFDAKIS